MISRCFSLTALVFCLAAGVGLAEAPKKAEPEEKQPAKQPKTGEVRTFDGIEMVWCPPGTFTMGSNDGGSDEKPVHQVTLTEGFWLGKYEVTLSEWERAMGSNPSNFKGSKNPVERVSWRDVQSFCKKLGNGFRLPTEAEWEYACRAGTTSAYSWGND